MLFLRFHPDFDETRIIRTRFASGIVFRILASFRGRGFGVEAVSDDEKSHQPSQNADSDQNWSHFRPPN